MNGILDHSFAVQVEVEADCPESRIELLSHVTITTETLK